MLCCMRVSSRVGLTLVKSKIRTLKLLCVLIVGLQILFSSSSSSLGISKLFKPGAKKENDIVRQATTFKQGKT